MHPLMEDSRARFEESLENMRPLRTGVIRRPRVLSSTARDLAWSATESVLEAPLINHSLRINNTIVLRPSTGDNPHPGTSIRR